MVLTTTVQASPPVDWIKAPGATAELVPETMFAGRVALYRAGPPGATESVVLVHGLGKAAARDWTHVIPALAQRYAVYAVDLPGFGYSDKGNHHYSPDNLARALDTVLTPRIAGRFTLIGHSMGGTVALAYAATYPSRVNRLVLVDVAGVLHRSVYAEFLGRVAAQRAIGLDSPWFESVVRAIQLRAENWPVRGDLVLERAGVRARMLRGDPSAIAAFAMVEHDFSASLRAIVAPTLIIWGADDTIAPLRTGQALAAAIPGARLTVIEGAGHAPQVQYPDRFNPLLIDELDGRQFAAQSYALRTEPIQGRAHRPLQRAARPGIQRRLHASGARALPGRADQPRPHRLPPGRPFHGTDPEHPCARRRRCEEYAAGIHRGDRHRQRGAGREQRRRRGHHVRAGPGDRHQRGQRAGGAALFDLDRVASRRLAACAARHRAPRAG